MPLRTCLHLCGLFLMGLTAITLSGCTHLVPLGGDLSLRSVSREGARLEGAFPTAYYAMENENRLTLVLIDGPQDNPLRAVTLRMQWRPRAGSTPIDRSATNATLHYAVFSGESQAQVGIYSGAGFVFPRGAIGDPVLRLSLWDSSLRLLDRTEGFADLLGPALLTGEIRVEHNTAETRRLIAQLDRLLTQRLGYPRLVRAR